MPKAERADARQGAVKRTIIVNGKTFDRPDADPVMIARSIRRTAGMAAREARLQEAEKKLGLR